MEYCDGLNADKHLRLTDWSFPFS